MLCCPDRGSLCDMYLSFFLFTFLNLYTWRVWSSVCIVGQAMLWIVITLSCSPLILTDNFGNILYFCYQQIRWKAQMQQLIPLTSIIPISLCHKAPLLSHEQLKTYWATSLRWVTCYFIMMEMGTVVYCESIPHAAENSPIQIHSLLLFEQCLLKSSVTSCLQQITNPSLKMKVYIHDPLLKINIFRNKQDWNWVPQKGWGS